MKRYLIALGAMLAATLSLTNCAEEFQTGPDPVGTTYTIYANAADTKTVNDGFSTKWSDYDSLNVFHVESGSAWMSDNIKFTILDVEEGEFIAEGFDESALSEVNDWYVLYPYNPYVISPSALDESGYFALGGKVGRPQVQYGNDNMDHIGGNNYPMWAVAKELPVTVIPEVMMTHLTSLVEVVVANNSEVPMTVTSISFDAPENITGTYYIGIDEEEPYFVSSGDAYVSDVVRLTVKDGEPIEPGSSAKFYFAIKPFTAPAGETLSLSVNSIVKTFELTQDVVFSPGKVKTLNFNVDEYYVPEPGPYSGNMLLGTVGNAYIQAAVINGEEGVSVLKLGTKDYYGEAAIKVPAGANKIGFYAVSWDGYPANVGLYKGSEVIGEVAAPSNAGATSNPPYQIEEEDELCYFEIPVNASEEAECTFTSVGNPRVIIWGINYYDENGDYGDAQEPTGATVAEFINAEPSNSDWYKVTGRITRIANTKYGNFDLEDETGSIYVYGLTATFTGRNDQSFSSLGLKVGDVVTIVGIRSEYKGTPQMGTSACESYYVSHEAGSTDLAPEMLLLVSDSGQKTWTYAPEFSYGNGGHSGNGSGFDNGAVDGRWWGVDNADQLKDQISHAGGVTYGDEANDAYMIFSEDGIVNTYDPAGKLIRGGNFEVKNYDPSRASGWEIGKLVTSEPALLFPWSINESGKGVTEYDLMYLTDQQMTLVYTKGNSVGSWGEITYWRFVAKGAE